MNIPYTYFKSICERLHCPLLMLIQSSNLSNFSFRQLSTTMRRTLWASVSIFHHFISRIIQVCPEKKVIRTHARRIVAMMKNLITKRYFASKQFIGKTVGRETTTFSYSESTITLRSSAEPKPTMFSLFNFRLKKILRSADKEMSRIHALDVATRIINSTMARRWVSKNKICHLAGRDHYILSLGAIRHNERSFTSHLSLPFPTRSFLYDFHEEPIVK